MPDLDDAVDKEIRANTPGVAPSFDLLVERRRRRSRRAALGTGVVVLGAVAAIAVVTPHLLSSDDAPQPSRPTTAPQAAAPVTLVIDCGGAGPVLPNGPRVAAQADGVHYSFRNSTDLTMHVSFALGGDAVAPHGSLSATTSRATPGTSWAVSCSDDIETLKEHELPVVVEDPSSLFIPVPECNGPTAITDFGQPLKGEPVQLTLQSHDSADVVGYPQGRPRLVYTGDSLISWESLDDGWVPSETTQCQSSSPHVVGAGIKAPPPTELAHTDEFGIVTRVTGSGADLQVSVDRVDMLSGQEAVAASLAAGKGGDVPNDYFLRNDNTITRTYRVAPDVVVWGSIRMHMAEPWPRRTTPDSWEHFVSTKDGAQTLFHFEITDGVVTGIEEQYLP